MQDLNVRVGNWILENNETGGGVVKIRNVKWIVEVRIQIDVVITNTKFKHKYVHKLKSNTVERRNQ